MRSLTYFALLISSAACIVAGYYENFTLGIVAAVFLCVTWFWSRRRFMKSFMPVKQGVLVEEVGDKRRGSKRAKKENLRRDRSAQG